MKKRMQKLLLGLLAVTFLIPNILASSVRAEEDPLDRIAGYVPDNTEKDPLEKEEVPSDFLKEKEERELDKNVSQLLSDIKGIEEKNKLGYTPSPLTVALIEQAFKNDYANEIANNNLSKELKVFSPINIVYQEDGKAVDVKHLESTNILYYPLKDDSGNIVAFFSVYAFNDKAHGVIINDQFLEEYKAAVQAGATKVIVKQREKTLDDPVEFKIISLKTDSKDTQDIKELAKQEGLDETVLDINFVISDVEILEEILTSIAHQSTLTNPATSTKLAAENNDALSKILVSFLGADAVNPNARGISDRKIVEDSALGVKSYMIRDDEDHAWIDSRPYGILFNFKKAVDTDLYDEDRTNLFDDGKKNLLEDDLDLSGLDLK